MCDCIVLITSEISTTVKMLLQFGWIQKIKYIIPTDVDGAEQTIWGTLCLTDLWTNDKNVKNKKLNLTIYEDITHERNSLARKPRKIFDTLHCQVVLDKYKTTI